MTQGQGVEEANSVHGKWDKFQMMMDQFQLMIQDQVLWTLARFYPHNLCPVFPYDVHTCILFHKRIIMKQIFMYRFPVYIFPPFNVTKYIFSKTDY